MTVNCGDSLGGPGRLCGSPAQNAADLKKAALSGRPRFRWFYNCSRTNGVPLYPMILWRYAMGQAPVRFRKIVRPRVNFILVKVDGPH